MAACQERPCRSNFDLGCCQIYSSTLMGVSGGQGRPQANGASRAVVGHAVAAPPQIHVPARASTPYERKINVVKVCIADFNLRAINTYFKMTSETRACEVISRRPCACWRKCRRPDLSAYLNMISTVLSASDRVNAAAMQLSPRSRSAEHGQLDE